MVDLHHLSSTKKTLATWIEWRGTPIWELIKEVSAAQELLRDHGHVHDPKAVSAFFNGQHADVKTTAMKYKRGANAVGYLSPEKVGILFGIYGKANDPSLFTPEKPTGPSKLVDLIDSLEDRLVAWRPVGAISQREVSWDLPGAPGNS